MNLIRSYQLNLAFGMLLLLLTAGMASAAAVDIPTTAQVDRIKPQENKPILPKEEGKVLVPKSEKPRVNAPAMAKEIKLVLKGVEISGATIFSPKLLKKTYKEYLDKEVTLEVAWIIADRITEKYRRAGYFLSRAYVPEQEIGDGIIKINVVEGYVGEVNFQNPDDNNRVLKQLIKQIKNEKPLKASQLESFLLRANDISSVPFKGVLSASQAVDEAAVKMTLVQTKKENQGVVTFDNYGSRFIGPYQATASYRASFIPLNKTTLSTVVTTPMNELKYGYLEHQVILTPTTKLSFNTEITDSDPGYTLKQFELKSDSNLFGAHIDYQMLRQRQENLSFRFGIDARNSNTDILGTELTHDNVRTASIGAFFDDFDDWNGYNAGNINITRGLDIFNSSEAGDLNLSREGAKPNFTKYEIMLRRQQRILDDLVLQSSFSGQRSTGILFSSEQFGYGGQGFGRAYDPSDITGDHGWAFSFELDYGGIGSLDWVNFTPYTFYDYGKAWKEKPQVGEEKSLSGSSAGIGMRFDTSIDLTGNIGLAYPLTRDIDTPINGKDRDGPRVIFQLSKYF
jgi:hemolysin activation/secretion protein